MAAPDIPVSKTRSAYSQWWTVLVLLITLVITGAAWYSARLQIERESTLYFDFRVRQLLDSIQVRMEAYQQMLYGVRGLFIASDAVSRDEFHTYVEALHLDQFYPGIQGVGYSVLIAPADKAKHVAAIRKQGFPSYNITPSGERDPYSAIIYLEPFRDRNLRAFGYDMFSEPVRNRAMLYARDNNAVGMTGKVILLQETDQDVQAGFLMYLPVYHSDLPHDDLEQRRDNLIGWVYAPFRIKDFLAGIGGEQSSDLGLDIFDGEQPDSVHRMYGEALADNHLSFLSSSHHLEIGGNTWTLLIHANANFRSRINQDKPKYIAGFGLMTSLLLTLLTWQLVNGRGRALQLAHRMTEELQESEARFRLMADSAPVLIWVSRTDKLCFWFNKVWLDFTGRSQDQEFGNGWIDGVHPEDLAYCQAVYNDHFERRQPFSMEYRLKRHDGEYRWLLDNGIPRFDQEGHFAGFIGSCIDITERKLMQTALEVSNADLTRFAEVSAHHLMEPTRRFTSYTQRLKKRLSNFPLMAEDEEISINLTTLEQDAQLLRCLILDIQRYLSASEPRGEVKFLNSNEIVTEIQKKLSPRLQAIQATLRLADLPPVMLDRPRFIDLVTLILDNTLRHGQLLEPQTRLQIDISGERIGHVSRFYIGDNGPGIPIEYQRRVWEIFERLGPRTANSGTGIGLAIARRIVESRQGSIGFKNTAQGGTCVVFELPDGNSGESYKS
ncbi:MAG: CHASE domain-containing protein [Methylomonas lenta]|nr:CHASE domain-containing protein [Methylomonas lenta]